jgi:hypothetical protein
MRSKSALQKVSFYGESHVICLLNPAAMLGAQPHLSIAVQMTLRHALLADKRLPFASVQPKI